MAIKVTPKKISQLDLAATLTGAEEFAVKQVNKTVRLTVANLQAFTDMSCQCTLTSRYDQVCTDADTIETYAQTYTLDANTLTNNGEYITIFSWGSFAANANVKDIKVYFGGTVVYDLTTAASGKNWNLNGHIVRTSNTTEKARFWSNLDSGDNDLTTPTETLSTDIPIAFSIQNGSASADDICVEGFIIELHKIDPDS